MSRSQRISFGRPVIGALLGLSTLTSLAYAGLSIEIAATLAYENPKPVLTTLGNLRLA